MLERSGSRECGPTGRTETGPDFARTVLDHCVGVRALLATLTAEPAAPETVERLRRAMHDLTGIAGVVGYPPLSEASIRLRDAVSTLLQADRVPTATECRALEETLGGIVLASHALTGERGPHLVPLALQGKTPRLGAPRVFLVEDDCEQANRLGKALRAAGYDARAFTDLDTFRVAVESERPDAVIMDMMFPQGDEAGAGAIANLQQSNAAGVPVIVVSARDDLNARLSALRAGACRYLTKPVDTDHLVDQLDTVTDRQPSEPYRVLMVDDEPLSLELHAALLRSAGLDVQTLSEPLGIFEALEAQRPDVLLLDQSMPDASGPEIAAVLRERDVYRHMPILFLSAETDSTRQLTALNLGGDDFLVKPVDPHYLIAAVTARARRARENGNATERLRNILYERERVRLALDRHAIVSVADRSGAITHVNDKFCEVSGYERDELIGQNHRIVRSDHHPPAFYHGLWSTIASGGIWKGEICNRKKDGSLYWVESTIVPYLDDRGKPYQYVSIRTEITRVKEAEERLRLSQNYANIGTWDWNIRTGELLWSQRIAPLFGYPEGKLETTYENFLNAVHPDDRQMVIDAVQACVEDGVKYGIEHRCVWPDGTVRWLHETGDVVRDRNGTPANMLGVVQDITDRRQAEAALEKERALLEEAQRIAQLGNWEIVEGSSKLHWSPVVFRIFGQDPATCTPTLEGFHRAVHPDDRALVRAAIDQASETGYYDVVHRIVRPDGELRHVHERARIEFDGDGNPMIRRGVVQDVTAMKRAESALQALNLRQNEQLETAHCLRDVTKHTLNDALTEQEMLEACIDRVQSGGVLMAGSSLRITHGSRSVVTAEFRETAHKLAISIPFFEDGGAWIEAFLPDGDQAGAGPTFTSTQEELLRDIARQIGQALIRREDRRALLLAKDQAEAGNRAKSDFLSSMSHELRTPLNAILGFAQVLEIDELTEDQLDSVQTIRRSGQHLLRLINEVLDLARIESGKLDLSIETVDLADIFNGCGSLIGPLAEGRGVTMTFERGPGASAVQADNTRLKQVLVNLMSNAVKYNRQGGNVTVGTTLTASGRVRIAVTDTGAGIPHERLGQLFTPFSRLGAEATETEGTGIGLVISKRLIEAMDGQIGVETRAGAGSTFWIDLPAAETPVHKDPEPATRRVPSILPPGTVLYVEDNPANLKLVRQALARHPQITLLEAHNGSLGIDIATAHRPDLILLDINMPGMDGLEMLSRLRAEPATRSIPAVAISAAAMEKDIRRAMDAGFRRYLTKPIDIAELLETVGELLGAPDRRVSGDRRAGLGEADAGTPGDTPPQQEAAR